MSEHNLALAIPDLIEAVIKEEQVATPVIHRFGPGIYIREGYMPAGSIVIGHTHRQEHMNVMLKGRLLLLREDGSTTELIAPACFTASKGRKIAYVIEDTVWQNIYATEETDVEKLEEIFLDKSEYELPALPLDDILLLSYAGDNEDFELAIGEFGLTPEQVYDMSSGDEDIIPFPSGGYKVVLADSLIHGKGLFASFPIEEGEIIAPARLNNHRTPAGRYTNHSRNPNAKAVKLENGDMYIVATKPINGATGGYLGDEITLDYRQVLSLNDLRRIE